MSNPTSADQFITELANNSDLRQQVESAGSPEALSGLLAARGFTFTPEELKEAVARSGRGSDLSDEELEGVAGGNLSFENPIFAIIDELVSYLSK